MNEKLRVIIDNKQNVMKIPTGVRMLIRRCCKAVLVHENFTDLAEISVSIVDDETIHELNLRHRGMDKSTDVLSFPMIEYAYPSDFTVLESDGFDSFDPDTGELILGDIVISVDKVIEQAEKYNHGVKREYAFLIAHSMLHLFGYDHMDEVERENMEFKQDEILTRLNITR